MAVIAAFKFNGQVPAGEAARQTNRAHAGFRSGIHQAHHLNGRNGIDNQLGQFYFAAGRRTETGAEFENGRQTFDDRLGPVSGEQRPPGADVVDVFVSIDIEDVRAFAARNEARRTAYASESAHRRIHTARSRLLGPGKQRLQLRQIHTWVSPRINLRNTKLIRISWSVVLTFRRSLFFMSRYGKVPAKRSCMISQNFGLRFMKSIMRVGTAPKKIAP